MAETLELKELLSHFIDQHLQAHSAHLFMWVQACSFLFTCRIQGDKNPNFKFQFLEKCCIGTTDDLIKHMGLADFPLEITGMS